MISAERFRRFVENNANERDLARLRAILEKEPAPRSVARAIEALQNEDGGFPIGETKGPSSVRGTCRTLALLRSLPPLGGSPMASRALSYLRRTQRPDGAWSEDQEGVTAEALFTLALMAPEHPQPAKLASEHLGDWDLDPLDEIFRDAGRWLLGDKRVVPPVLPEDLPDLARGVAAMAEAQVGGPWHRLVQEGLRTLAGALPIDMDTVLLTLQALKQTGYIER